MGHMTKTSLFLNISVFTVHGTTQKFSESLVRREKKNVVSVWKEDQNIDVEIDTFSNERHLKNSEVFLLTFIPLYKYNI